MFGFPFWLDVKTVDVTEFLTLGRAISTNICKDVSWRSVRSYMVTEAVEQIPNEGSELGETSDYISIKVRG